MTSDDINATFIKQPLQPRLWRAAEGFETLPAMADAHENPESLRAIQQRMRDLQVAYARLKGVEKTMSKAEFARQVGITPQAWNAVITQNRIGIDQALLVCRLTGVDLDWIYRGRTTLLPQQLAAILRAIEGERRPTARPKRA